MNSPQKHLLPPNHAFFKHIIYFSKMLGLPNIITIFLY
jgi:hypothetical protein